MQKVISKFNTIITKEYLQQQQENQYFERKGLGEKEIKPTKIAEELIGMLNADGGVLVFGISDKGEIQDLKTLDNLDAYRKLVFDFVDPPCTIELEEIEIDGNLVFLFHVEQELERVFQRKDNQKVYLRVSDENRELDRERVRKLEYDKMIRRFEEEIVSNFDKNDLDEKLLATYQEKLNYSKGNSFDLLNKRHLLDKKEETYQFKNAAVLLFAKDPEKYIPSASVRYIRYQGIEAKVGEEHNVIKDERFENNIPNLIDELRVFLKASFKDYYFLDITEGKFIKVPEYPEAAWLEGIVNALCHRSYNVQGNSVYIKHFDDRIEISNSGPLPAQVTIENIKTERFARNPRLTRVLEDLGYVRQLNEGVSRIYESMEKSMLSLPEYKEKNGNVILTLKNRISDHSKTIDTSIMKVIENKFSNYNETQRSILFYLFLNGSATVSELSAHTGINENTIRTYLNTFMNENLIDRLSVKKRDINAKYVFKKQ
ncbi:RNA-binding domain-containing protein [Acinetobacter sp. WCHA29]|uniref:RNA-binding domain-containing protein n=1 Tax=Acinetobacter sp. WCHA29 TaxID=2004649 RepID=UPI000B3CB76D|nr:ATP-binding protein [Acinetobacter sp. WCHA29]